MDSGEDGRVQLSLSQVLLILLGLAYAALGIWYLQGVNWVPHAKSYAQYLPGVTGEYYGIAPYRSGALVALRFASGDYGLAVLGKYGDVLWSARVGGPILAFAASEDGSVYVAAGIGNRVDLLRFPPSGSYAPNLVQTLSLGDWSVTAPLSVPVSDELVVPVTSQQRSGVLVLHPDANVGTAYYCVSCDFTLISSARYKPRRFSPYEYVYLANTRYGGLLFEGGFSGAVDLPVLPLSFCDGYLIAAAPSGHLLIGELNTTTKTYDFNEFNVSVTSATCTDGIVFAYTSGARLLVHPITRKTYVGPNYVKPITSASDVIYSWVVGSRGGTPTALHNPLGSVTCPDGFVQMDVNATSGSDPYTQFRMIAVPVSLSRLSSRALPLRPLSVKQDYWCYKP